MKLLMLISEHYYQMPHHLHMRKAKLLKDKYTEALAAVQAMKNNKNSGPDGYTPEFYIKKKCFRDIGNVLVRSINYGFQNEERSVTPKQGIITCIPKEGKPR